MRLREIFREAARNFSSGASRGLLFLAAFLAIVLSLGFVAAREVVSVSQEATDFRASGAAIYRLTAEGSIDGADCDALATIDGVDAAGATRAAPPAKFSLLPSLPTPLFEATLGMTELLGVSPLDPGSGLVLEKHAAESIGVDGTPASVLLDDGTAVQIAGTYMSPDDGRESTLAGAAIAVGLTSQPYDTCWASFWPPVENPLDVIGPAVTARHDGGNGDLIQWNTTRGKSFDPRAAFGRIPFVAFLIAAAVLSGIAAFVAVRLRRLELAAARHLGVSRVDLAATLVCETVLWLIPAVVLAFVVQFAVAGWENPDPPLPASSASARVLVAASVSWLVTTCISAALSTERHLVRYFQQR